MELSDEIFAWPEMAAIETAGDMRASQPAARQLYFIRLVAMSLSGTRFLDGKHFSRMCGCSRKAQAAIAVWDTCIRIGILEDDGHGYTMTRWLESKTRENLHADAPVLVGTCNDMPEGRNSRQRQKQAAKNGIDGNTGGTGIQDAPPNGRFRVRDNIMLNAVELAGIRAVHGDETERVLDEVSDWIRRKGASPRNVAAIVEGWGHGGTEKDTSRRRHPLEGVDLSLILNTEGARK